MRIELTTFSLATRDSTTELRPQGERILAMPPDLSSKNAL